MDDNNQENKNRTIARELSHKYEYYFIALVFTILAFSIQTTEMVNKFAQVWFEIISWVLLMISGLIGLSRLERIPVVYRHQGTLQEIEAKLLAIKQGVEQELEVADEYGQEYSKDELIRERKSLEEQIFKGQIKTKKLDFETITKYRIHKWAFLAGMMSLIISRAILHLSKIGIIK